MKPVESICIVRRDNIGDLVCTTPAIRLLRQSFPRARIFALVNSYNAEVLMGNPDLDAVYAYHKGKHAKGAVSAALSNIKVLREIRAQRPDVAIGCSSAFSKTLAWYTFLTGARQRIGYADKASSRSFYNLAQAPPENPLHEVEAVVRLLAPLGISGPAPGLFVRPDDAEVKKVLASLRGSGFEGKERLVAFHISSRKPHNRWPKAHFSELAKAIQQKFNLRPLLLWSPGKSDNPLHPGDDEKAEWILSNTSPRPLAFRTEKLGELIAALSICDMAVCSDGGAMHIAAGLGKPVLTIWGSTDQRRWAPWGVPHRILQKKRDASEITPAEALEGFEGLFRNLSGMKGAL